MSNIFFTSDTHYFHDNIIQYCNRPFFNVKEMNSAMVDKWNAVVRPNDRVYHLGDVAFSWSFKFEEICNILRSLNGNKILILGNHDKQMAKRLANIQSYMPFVWHDVFSEPFMFNPKIMLSHYPRWNDFLANDGWILHGHEHNAVPKRQYKLYDVGVDGHNFAPVAFEDIAKEMYSRRDYISEEEKAEPIFFEEGRPVESRGYYKGLNDVDED